MLAALNSTDWQNVILIGTLAVAGFGAYLAVRSTRRASQAEVLYEVMTMLQAPEMRNARRIIYITKGQRAAEPRLNEAEVEYACQAYATVGMLLRHRYLVRRHFIRHHGGTVLRVYEAATPYMQERAPRMLERESWPTFGWLARRARRRFRWYRRHHADEKRLHAQWRSEHPKPSPGTPPPPF